MACRCGHERDDHNINRPSGISWCSGSMHPEDPGDAETCDCAGYVESGSATQDALAAYYRGLADGRTAVDTLRDAPSPPCDSCGHDAVMHTVDTVRGCPILHAADPDGVSERCGCMTYVPMTPERADRFRRALVPGRSVSGSLANMADLEVRALAADLVPQGRGVPPSSAMRESLARVAAAQATNSGAASTYLRDGSGRLVLKSFELAEGFQGQCAVFEFMVDESHKKFGLVSLRTHEPVDVEPNAPGSDVAVVMMLEKHYGAVGRVKELALALFGFINPSTATIRQTNGILQDLLGGGGVGRQVRYDTYRRVSQSGVELVLPRWAPVAQSPQDVALRRQLLFGRAGQVTGAAGARAAVGGAATVPHCRAQDGCILPQGHQGGHFFDSPNDSRRFCIEPACILPRGHEGRHRARQGESLPPGTAIDLARTPKPLASKPPAPKPPRPLYGRKLILDEEDDDDIPF